MLRLLTDSHVPPAIAAAARRQGRLEITPLRDWHGGIYLHEQDPKLLALAWQERMTIVTYDVNTFPLHVKARLEIGLNHSGVVYVSARYRQNNIGAITRGLLRLWKLEGKADWMNRIHFLDR
jgi:hypothetical protein